MSILVDKNTRVVTQGITGKTGQFHTRMCRDYANGRNCFVAGVVPKKGGENFEGIPIFNTVREAKDATGANVSVIYVPPPFAAAAIDEAVEAADGGGPDQAGGPDAARAVTAVARRAGQPPPGDLALLFIGERVP